MKTKLLPIILLLGTVFCLSCDIRKKAVYVYSPDMEICVAVTDSALYVEYGNQLVQTVKIDFAKRSNWSIFNLQRFSYNMVSGKRSDCSDYYNELIYNGA